MKLCLLARATTHQAIALALFGVLATGVSTAACANVIVTPVGSPLFVAADFHLFAAPIGTASQWLRRVLRDAAAHPATPQPFAESDPGYRSRCGARRPV